MLFMSTMKPGSNGPNIMPEIMPRGTWIVRWPLCSISSSSPACTLPHKGTRYLPPWLAICGRSRRIDPKKPLPGCSHGSGRRFRTSRLNRAGRWLPVVGKQFAEPGYRVRGTAREHIMEPRERLDPAPLAGSNGPSQHGRRLAAVVATEKGPVAGGAGARARAECRWGAASGVLANKPRLSTSWMLCSDSPASVERVVCISRRSTSFIYV